MGYECLGTRADLWYDTWTRKFCEAVILLWAIGAERRYQVSAEQLWFLGKSATQISDSLYMESLSELPCPHAHQHLIIILST